MILKLFLTYVITTTVVNPASGDLMNAFEVFISERWEELYLTYIDMKETIQEKLAEKVIPVSQLPFYKDRAENKTYDKDLFRSANTEPFRKAEVKRGYWYQTVTQSYGFYDMSDVKENLREFAVNLAEIMLYRGIHTFKDAMKKYDSIELLRPDDIKPIQLEADTENWWVPLMNDPRKTSQENAKNKKLLDLYGEKIGENKFRILSPQEFAIKMRYYKLSSEFAEITWYLYHIYTDQFAPRESLIHQHLKQEQINGHFLGNPMMTIFLKQEETLSDKIKILTETDFDKWKNDVQSFVSEVEFVLTGEKAEQIKLSFRQKMKQYAKKKINWTSEKPICYTIHDLKLEVLRDLLQKGKENTKSLDSVKAMELMVLFTNDWRIFYFLHVSGTVESTKVLPEFYNSNIPNNEYEPGFYDESQPEEWNAKTGSRKKRVDENDYKSTEVGPNENLEDTDEEFVTLEGKNPFRDIVEAAFNTAKINFKTAKEKLVKGLKEICANVTRLEECNFIDRVIADIHTNIVSKNGKIAGKKFCTKNKEACKEIDYKSYFMYIRKITEIQATCMATLEYLMLECKRKKITKGWHKEDRKEIKNRIEELFKEEKILSIFITKEYQKILTQFINGSKDSNVLKLIDMKIEAEKKGEEMVERKPKRLNIRDMDVTLERECYSCFINNEEN